MVFNKCHSLYYLVMEGLTPRLAVCAQSPVSELAKLMIEPSTLVDDGPSVSAASTALSASSCHPMPGESVGARGPLRFTWLFCDAGASLEPLAKG